LDVQFSFVAGWVLDVTLNETAFKASRYLSFFLIRSIHVKSIRIEITTTKISNIFLSCPKLFTQGMFIISVIRLATRLEGDSKF
jgi:hypothetical protein